jgi:hypothetical protein
MKYYTPKIEEFHVGFEYEFHAMTTGGMDIVDFSQTPPKTISSVKPMNKFWVQSEIHVDDFGLISRSLEKIKELLESDQIRVKYLDRDDIESCSFNTEDNGECYNKTNAFDIYGLYPWEWDKGIQNQYKIILNGDTLFLGIIKNKSELKVLLKQLNIDEK